MCIRGRAHSFGGVVLTALAILFGCTQSNPASKCTSGTCSDPAFPYCDVDGLFADAPGSCIAVTCVPGEVAMCHMDHAITCTDDGAAYEHVPCDLGCLDSPKPHCAYIEPRYLPDICDAVATDDELTITSSATFDPNLDSNCNGGVIEQTGAPAICVVRYRKIVIESDKTLTVVGPPTGLPGRPVAFVSDDALEIHGVLDVGAKGNIDGPGGGVVESGALPDVNSSTKYGGGGAGGHTAGAAGGSNTVDGGGANGGAQAADPAFLAALLGGASAAKLRNATEANGGGGGGGAATLVSCRGAVQVSGAINAAGGGGKGGTYALVSVPGFGGGAGGYVVLQAKEITVTGQLFANGGGGGAGYRENGAAGAPGEDGTMSATASAAGGAPLLGEGAGGRGGVDGTPPTVGRKPTTSPALAGGGGGAAGFFQTYTPIDRAPVLQPTAISPEFQPNGVIKTR